MNLYSEYESFLVRTKILTEILVFFVIEEVPFDLFTQGSCVIIGADQKLIFGIF